MPLQRLNFSLLLRKAFGTRFHAELYRHFGAKIVVGEELELSRRADVIEQSGLFDHEHYRSELNKRSLCSEIQDLVRHYEEVGDKLRISPHPLFDNHFYHERYPDIAQSGMSSLFHYITHGSDENRQPHPLFDTKYVRDQIKTKNDPLRLYLSSPPGQYNPHALIDAKFIVEQMQFFGEKIENPLIFFLRAGEKINPSRDFDCLSYREWYPDIQDLNAFYHYVRWGIAEGRTITSGALSITRVAAEINEAASLDPDLLAPHTNIHRIPRISRVEIASAEEALLHKLAHASSSTETFGVLFLPSLALGGAERVSANIIDSILSSDDDVGLTLFLTDSNNTGSANWFLKSDRLTVCNIHEEIAAIGPLEAAAQVLAIYLQIFAPRFVLINNSKAGWLVAEQHGKAIRSFSRLIATAFCYDFDQYGRRGGYAWTHLCHSIELLDRVVTDNSSFSYQLCGDLRLDEANARKLFTLYQPIEVKDSPELGGINRPGNSMPLYPTVLWASRFARQKRVLLGLEVARMLPKVRFVFAGGTKDDLEKSSHDVPRNVEFFGAFDRFEDLLHIGCSVFLYTSQYDGIPNVLLEAAAAGLSIVAPNVGGIGELVTDRTGWLIAEHSSPHAYAKALNEIMSHPSEAEQRTRQMHALLRRRHSHAQYAHAVRNALFLQTES